jgi:hypothetical protein
MSVRSQRQRPFRSIIDWLTVSRRNRCLPIRFFTIVLNGMPYLRHHLNELSQLSCNWEWHVVEGVARLENDTGWSVANGGSIPNELVRNGLSTDGTSEYLDRIKEEHANNVFLYRKKNGLMWAGKIEMIRAAFETAAQPCLAWQIDSDELWTAAQIESVKGAFMRHPKKTAAWFWCNYYVGPDIRVTSRNCYSQNPNVEWLRVWNYRPSDKWQSHEPPLLVRRTWRGYEMDVARMNPFSHAETEKMGAVFDHHAYTTDLQLKFKEGYYGYRGALAAWRRMQTELPQSGEHRLAEYLPWVKDDTKVARVACV